MFSGIGIPELLIVFLIVLLFFGAKRLPEIGGSLGKGIREFKDSLKDVEDEVRGELEAPRESEDRDHESRTSGSGSA